MNASEWNEHWTSLYKTLKIIDADSYFKDRKTPTDSHLDKAEAILKISFPQSYRTFVKVFGPGRLARSIVVRAPGYRSASVVDLLGANKWHDYEAGRSSDPDRIRGLVAFASVLDDFIVWDKNMPIQGNGDNEFAIFKMPRRPKEALIQMADTFSSFVDSILDGSYQTTLGWTAEPLKKSSLRSMRCFEPIAKEPSSNV